MSDKLVPPKLKMLPDGGIEPNSLADLLEFFLLNDQKVMHIRSVFVEELFQWKQQSDADNGIATYPFENAEARFAIGAFQALAENNTQLRLQQWITDLLEALGGAKETNEDIEKAHELLSRKGKSPLEESKKIPSEMEQRIYLSSNWIEALCIAEVRFLGWVYQELYGKPFEPITEPTPI
jgi:hypothetical protein